MKLTEKIKLKEAASVFEADRGRQEHTQSAEDGAPTRPGLDAGAGVTFPRVPSTCEASGALGFFFSREPARARKRLGGQGLKSGGKKALPRNTCGGRAAGAGAGLALQHPQGPRVLGPGAGAGRRVAAAAAAGGSWSFRPAL